MTADLCELAEVRRAMRLQPADTRDDGRISQAITLASGMIHRHLGRTWILNEDQVEVTEYHDGEGRAELALGEWPVASVTSVHDSLERTFGAADELEEDEDFMVQSSDYGASIRLLALRETGSALTGGARAVFQDGVQNVRVVYVPGYATRAALPRELVNVAITETIALLTKQQHAGTTRVQVGDLAEDFDLASLRPESRATLARFRRFL